MRRNTTQPEDATIRDAINFSGISDLIDIIDRLDEENTTLNDRIEGLEALLTEKESFIRDLESRIEAL